MKKLTKTERAAEILKSAQQLAAESEVIREMGLAHVAAEYTVVAGEEHYRMHCHCGWDYEGPKRYWACPQCRAVAVFNKTGTWTDGLWHNHSHSAVFAAQDGDDVLVFDAEIWYRHDETAPDWIKTIPDVNAHVVWAFRLSRGEEIVGMFDYGGLLTERSQVVSQAGRFFKIHSLTEGLDLSALIARLNNARNAHRTTGQKTVDFDILEPDMSRFLPIESRVWSDNGQERVLEHTCHSCGNVWHGKDAYMTVVECPKCRNTSRTAISSALVYAAEAGGLLIERVSTQWQGHEYRCTPTHAIIVRKTGAKVEAHTFEKHGEEGWKPSCLTSFGGAQTVATPKEDILSAIDQAGLGRSGFAEALGLVEGYAGCCKPYHPEEFLRLMKVRPVEAEVIAKANLPQVAKSLLCAGRNCPRGKSMSEILGISHHGLSIVRAGRLNYAEAKPLGRVLAQFPQTTTEDYLRLRDEMSVDMEVVAEVVCKYGITCQELAQYLDRAYMHQCIERRDTLVILRDYLWMATRCGFDLTDKKR